MSMSKMPTAEGQFGEFSFTEKNSVNMTCKIALKQCGEIPVSPSNIILVCLSLVTCAVIFNRCLP